MISQLIQSQIRLGSQVVFVLDSGQTMTGTLALIGIDDIWVENKQKLNIVSVNALNSWEIQSEHVPDTAAVTLLIQSQIPLGSKATFTYHHGQTVTGDLIQIGLEFISIKHLGKLNTIRVKLIEAWQIQSDEEPQASGATLPTNSSPEKRQPPLPPAVERPKTIDHSVTTAPPDTNLLQPSAPSSDGSDASVPLHEDLASSAQFAQPPHSVDGHEFNPGQAQPADESAIVAYNRAIPELMYSVADISAVPAASSPRNSSPLPAPTVDADTLRALLEIEVRFTTQLSTAKLELPVPTFVLPDQEIRGSKSQAALKTWERICGKYDYARKMNEVGTQFGRIPPIVQELNKLTLQFPEAATIKRHLVYFQHLSGNKDEALESCKEVLQLSKDASDWQNLAVIALECGERALACHSLIHLFIANPSRIKPANEWFVFIQLLMQYVDYAALLSIVHSLPLHASGEQQKILIETSVYLLKACGKEEQALRLIQEWKESGFSHALVRKALIQLESRPTTEYRQALSLLTPKSKAPKTAAPDKQDAYQKGYIYTYKNDRNYGFLRTDHDQKYFFHKNVIVDDELFVKINNISIREPIPVIFKIAEGADGPLAVSVSLDRTVDEIYKLALHYADEGEYEKAILQIKKVLIANATYPKAQDLHEKWRTYASVPGLPKGSGDYAKAKRVQLAEKDRERAAKLMRIAIKNNSNFESAVKDLAQLLDELGRPHEAIDVLLKNRGQSSNKQSIDNMLIGLYTKTGKHTEAIPLLQQKLERAQSNTERASLFWQLANNHLKLEDYTGAERYLKRGLTLQPNNHVTQRSLAICLFKQERFNEAAKILNAILDKVADAQTAQLLEAVNHAQKTGQSLDIDIIIDITLSSLPSEEVSPITQFFLDRCQFEGVKSRRAQEGKFLRSDIRDLEEIATQLGTQRPRERAGYYLSAAKITALLDGERTEQFYRYLCRCFSSMGDATVIEGGPLDTARELYAETLAAYDGVLDKSVGDEQDVVSALVRFLFATLGARLIPMKVGKSHSVDEAIEEVIRRHPQPDKVFDAIAYLVYRSRYASRILNRIYSKATLQALSLEYLKERGIPVQSAPRQFDDYVRLWNELRRELLQRLRTVANDFQFLAEIELKTSSIEDAIERTKHLKEYLFYDIELERVIELQAILEAALALCRQVTFEEQERLCLQILRNGQDLGKAIEENPTTLSIDELLPVLNTVITKTSTRLTELYQSSVPVLHLRLAKESYIPDEHRTLAVQIVVGNKLGCSPAEALQLIVQENSKLFALKQKSVGLAGGSLRGGEEEIIEFPLHVSEAALAAKAFSLAVVAQYRTRAAETMKVEGEFSIRLASENDFQEIPNPYALYAESGIVRDPLMFYGRNDFIERLAQTLIKAQGQNKSIIIYGQKRAGKSSILYHLKRRLEEAQEAHLLILDVGNIGSLLDEHAQLPFLYLFLQAILNKLEFGIEDRVVQGYSPLDLQFPTDQQFFRHESPLGLFKQIFERFQRLSSRQSDWKDTHMIIMLDEFSYIFEQIVKGKMPEIFMKNWKALLQENFFSVVLAGQDVMPKFKQRFANEFGTTQDEQITYLSAQDAQRLIDEPVQIEGQSRYREQAIERIMYLTAGSPYYIQILCNRLIEDMNLKKASLITHSDVEQVKNGLINGTNALQIDKFENLVNSGDTSPDAISDKDIMSVLTAVALNTRTSRTSRCSIRDIQCATDTPIETILDDLVKRKVIQREGQGYYSICVGLFKEWLIVHG